MKKIFKYEVALQGEFKLNIERHATILCCQMQNDKPKIWAIVDTEAPADERTFKLYGTGHEIGDTNLKYIDTIQLQDGLYVFHLFEVLKQCTS